MEDLEQPDTPTVNSYENEPQGNDDPNDPLRPDIEEENDAGGTPPMADPHADMEATDEMPTNGAEEGNGEEGDEGNPANTDRAVVDDDDDESELEELDEHEFADFDATALNIPDKPIDVDESNVALLGVHKRKRTAEEEAERERKKKKKEKKRDKPSRKRRTGEDEEDFEGGPEMDGKRSRKGKGSKPSQSSRRERTPVDLESLPPDERRRRALEAKMDEALKTHRVSRRKAAQDMEERADQEIADMRTRIAKACEADAQARARGDVAVQKLKILPEVVELMNRNTIQSQLVDPDINILESVRFMLEPADQDAALPNYQIQRELFAILSRLNIGKDALVASAIGKVVLFYTKSSQPQPDIKRQAEYLVAEWTRVILNKGKDARSKPVETRGYDPLVAAASQRLGGSQVDRAAQAAEKRKRVLEAPGPQNRARVQGGVGTYSIAPVSNLSNAQGVSQRRTQGSSDETFKRIAARSSQKQAKR
ncbi:Putative transcription factor IIS, TFIIS/LEDGF domain superfamily [Septoria linicola]|uniref:Transcription factor IIS, TFIIS/LEDGF domain superfamily n=1 Tax=Septoria linicola TaxID=215465 RepID=A0A9Q9ELH2_9PEZI|nr:putative transcription factor IIS, TFIIS/LEDGF domain superfamily [Septoria linicola]USW53448.1 Putative transcription factor IIS, TFIIS/LEDGF domain superfamily [Septoria linicola]